MMSASLIVFNNPLELGWQNNAVELLKLGLFAVFAWYSIAQYGRGARIYTFLMLSALI
ncbi:hypothetical protein [Mycobacterium sp. 94-17]|uniref:hypothetical protein n=1 Tax=Mycobacterium sp. 94-17 TaxID=2986147 RepID=UPI002D1E85FC|nr:hypothetical protein [Mycobacterium sp. 94-17]MEB4209541.1 hypothetical protein [Mycobacterium sp. 94-17]